MSEKENFENTVSHLHLRVKDGLKVWAYKLCLCKSGPEYSKQNTFMYFKKVNTFINSFFLCNESEGLKVNYSGSDRRTWNLDKKIKITETKQ